MLEAKQEQDNIPADWRLDKSSVFIDVRDGTHGTPKPVVNGVPLITSKNIIQGELDFQDHYDISEKDAFEINKRSNVERGDILVSMIGTVGESAIIKTEPNFVIKNVALFKTGSTEILSGFLIKQFQSTYFRKKFLNLSSGGIQKFISLGQLRNLKIIVPPLPEQHRIITILETWDQAIEKLTQKIELKKQIKKGLMGELLTGKRRVNALFPKWQTLRVDDVFSFIKTYALSREKLTQGKLTKGSVGNIHYGDIHSTYLSSNVDVSKVNIPIIKDASFRYAEEDYLKDGDLIMADASEDYPGVGVTVSIHNLESNNVLGGLHTFILRDEKGLTVEYYRQYIFRNLKIRNQLQKIANGVSVYGISKTALSKLKLTIPSIPEQTAIANILTTADQELQTLEKKRHLLKSQKTYLLNNLITGKLRTPETLSPKVML